MHLNVKRTKKSFLKNCPFFVLYGVIFIAEGESTALKGVGFLGEEVTAVVVVIGCELRKEVMLPETINFKLRAKRINLCTS